MKFIYDQELLLHMEKVGLKTIVVEFIAIENSDIEISDLRIRLINDRLRSNFLDKNYRIVETEHGEVLLPRYPLTFDDTVTFKLKKFLWFKSIVAEGIKI